MFNAINKLINIKIVLNTYVIFILVIKKSKNL